MDHEEAPAPSELFCEMTRNYPGYHSMRGPIDGVIIQPRNFQRVASDRAFGVGTPVEVCRPEFGWPIDRILVAQHEGFSYAKRLCAEDGEHPDNFVDADGKLTCELALGLCDNGRKTEMLSKIMAPDTIVQVYRRNDTYWAWSQDLGWNTWFSKDVDDIEQFIRVEDVARLDYMPEMDIVPQPVPIGRPKAPRRKMR